jgi:hypothetical protein
MTGAASSRTTCHGRSSDRASRVIDEHALYATCLHEYAHLAVARHFGACGFVTVQRLHAGEATWQGRFQLYGALDDDAWRIVALAGTLAERLFEGHPASAALLEAVLRKPGALSYCDAKLAQGFDRGDVTSCLAVLRDAWPAITCDARERVTEISGRLGSTS